MRKYVRCIASIQRIMEKENVTAEVACDMQEDELYDMIAKNERYERELESISGSPEQGIVLMFKDSKN